MEKKLFILQGNGPILNRGCEAILRSTVSILREEFGPCCFINAPISRIHPEGFKETDPDIVHLLPPDIKRWNVNWWKSQFERRLLRRSGWSFERYLPEAVATLALGGDNYSLDYVVPTAFFGANSVTIRYGKPLVIWGASVGPFGKNPKFEKFATKELKKVSLICARESETISYLASIGVTENVRAVSDPAFTLEPQIVKDDPNMSVIEQPCIGLSLSSLLIRYWRGEISWLDSATRCVTSVLRKNDLPIVLAPHVVYPQRNDHAFMQEIVNRLGKLKDRVKLIGPHYNAQQLKWIISRLTVFIGARTHATIAALSSAVPTISIGYSMKAKGINKDIFGHCDWVIQVNELQGDALGELTRKLLDAAPKVRRHLTEVMPAYKSRAKQAGKYLREIIEHGVCK